MLKQQKSHPKYQEVVSKKKKKKKTKWGNALKHAKREDDKRGEENMHILYNWEVQIKWIEVLGGSISWHKHFSKQFSIFY